MYRNDSDFIKACLSGKEAAWKDLVERYSRLVYSVALEQGLRIEDAEDVFQQVFTITFKQLRNLRDHKFIAAWLIRITTHECRCLHRHTSPTVEFDEMIPDPQDSPSDQVQAWERRHLIHLAMQQLASPCRQLWEMLFVEPPLSYEMIASRSA